MIRHYDLDAFNKVMRASPGELDAEIPRSAIQGEIPEELRGGTWWGNGPGRLDIGGVLVHPFDGHGFVRALRFPAGGGAPRLQARFVRTHSFCTEDAAGELRVRGLGTNLPGGARRNLSLGRAEPRNVANTCVLPFAGRVLALWEGGLPHALDPQTLATISPETFGGALSAEAMLLAHTRYDAAAGRLVGLTQSMQRLRTRFTFLEIDERGAVLSRARGDLPAMSLTHDFLITPRWYIVLESPVRPDLLRYLGFKAGRVPLIEVVRQRPEHSRALLVPRAGGAPRLLDLGHHALMVHHGNAWEEDGRLVLVTCAFVDTPFEFGREFGYQGPHRPLDPGSKPPSQGQRVLRYTIDPERGQVTHETLSPHAVDFPRVHPARDGLPTRFLFGAATQRTGAPDPFDSVARVDLQRAVTTLWTAGGGRFCGEPLFVPRAGAAAEDEGLVLVMVYDGREEASALCVLRAERLQDGPVAQIRMPALLPYGFHGHWQAAA